MSYSAYAQFDPRHNTLLVKVILFELKQNVSPFIHFIENSVFPDCQSTKCSIRSPKSQNP